MDLVSSIEVENRAQSLTLLEEDVLNTCDAVIEAIRNGLPEEAHTLEACRYVLHRTEEILETKAITLK